MPSSAWVERDRKGWRVRWRDDLGHKQTLPGSHSTRKHAQAEADALKVDSRRGAFVDPRGGQVLLGDFAALWREHRLVRTSTAAAQDSRLDRHILPAFGQRSLGQISRLEVQRWVAELDQQLAADTVRSCYRLLAQLLEAAVDEELLVRSPCRKIQLPKPDAREARALTPAEAGRLLTAIAAVRTWPSAHPLVLTLLGTGLRWGEATGLKRGRLQLLGRSPTLTVAEALHEVRGRLSFEAPKTKAARRVLPLPGVVVDALAAHLPPNGAAGDVVFRGPRGGLLRTSNWREDVWVPALKASGVFPEPWPVDADGHERSPLHVHDLRHTAISWLAAAGIPEHVRRAWAGHAGAGDVHGRYIHLLPGDADQVLAVLQERLAPAAAARATGPA
jgi:integrase